MKGSLIIIGFFILGTLCGFFHLIPFDISKSNISFYALCALMFSVGLSVGHDPQTLKNFRSLNPRLIFLPVATILGTVSAAALVSLILPHRSAPDCMAVGAGFGYYSFPVFLLRSIRGRNWVPLLCFPTLCVKLLLCFVLLCWCAGLVIWLLYRLEERLLWILRCPSLPVAQDSNLW